MLDSFINFMVRVETTKTQSELDDEGNQHEYALSYNGKLVGFDEQFIYLGVPGEAGLAINKKYIYSIMKDPELNDVQDELLSIEGSDIIN